jgi:hypothetical protein
MKETNDEAIASLKRHFNDVARLEHEIPRLVNLAYSLAGMLDRWASEHECPKRQIEFGSINWFEDGTIAFKIFKSLVIEKNYLEKESDIIKERKFGRIDVLLDNHKSVVKLLLSLASHLVSYHNQGFIDAKAVRFWQLRLVNDTVTFKIVHKNLGVKPRKVVIV